MFCSRIFGFLVILLSLVACLCVHSFVSEEDADDLVMDVQDLATTTLNYAQENYNEARSLMNRMQLHKRSAEEAALQAEKAAKGNEKAEAVAAEVQKASDKVIAAYAGAKAAADAAVNRMKELVAKAERLNREADIELLPDSEFSNDYSQIQNKASEVRVKLMNFQKEIGQTVNLLQPPSVAEWEMSQSVEKAKVARHHVFAVLSVSQIETVLAKADMDIRSAEQKRDEVDKTMNEMRELSKDASDELSVYVDKVLKNAEATSVAASKAVDDAQNAKEAMLGLKKSADAALAKFKGEIDSEKAANEATNAKRRAEEVAKKVSQITSALQSAEISAKNAKSMKQAFMRTLSKSNGEPVSEDNKVTKKPEEPVQDVTTKPASKGTDRPIDKKPEKPVKDGTQNPVKKETMPTSRANDDSAIAVSFSVLMLSIVFAAIH